VKVSEGLFQCREQAVTCSGNLCESGQVACLGGACACLSSLSGALDTCQTAGKWCNGRVCASPKSLQQCKPGDSTAACPTGFKCEPVFGDDLNICTRTCMDTNQCERGEFCSMVGCLPSGLFSDQECNQTKFAADGGFERDDGGTPLRITVPVSNTCLLKDADGNPTEAPGKGTGNCTYAVFQFWSDGVYSYQDNENYERPMVNKNVDCFYISPDLPELHIKQGYLLLNYIKQLSPLSSMPIDLDKFNRIHSPVYFDWLDYSLKGCGRYGDLNCSTEQHLQMAHSKLTIPSGQFTGDEYHGRGHTSFKSGVGTKMFKNYTDGIMSVMNDTAVAKFLNINQNNFFNMRSFPSKMYKLTF
jgi:hypothetical protein